MNTTESEMKQVNILTLILVYLFTVLPTYAAIIIVPDEEATLRDALDTAEPADTIMIEDEVYDGGDNTNLTIDSPITIMSVNGPENCIFDVSVDNSDWITIEAECSIVGLTIDNANNTISADNVDNLIISNCNIVRSSSNGIWLINSDNFEIANCQFIENGPSGSALRTEMSGGLLSNSVFDSNSRNGGSGGGVHFRESDDQLSIIVKNCVFRENFASGYGGGIYMTDIASALFRNCQIINNRVEENNGGGICITGSSSVIFESCIISENETPRSGGGFYISGGSVVDILHSFIIENTVDRSGGGLFVFNASEINLFNSVLTGNEAGIDGGGLAVTNNSIGDVINCDLVTNMASTARDNGMGGGFYSGNGTVSTVENCILIENDADIGDQMYTQNAVDIDISFTCIEDGVNPDGDWEFEELIDEDNFADDPELMNGTDPIWGLDGYFLSDESPCIDAGSEDVGDIGLDTLTTREDFEFDVDIVDIGFHYNVRWFDLRGRLYGTVLDAGNDNPLPNAHILTSFGQETDTDENGEWEIENAMAFPFSITASVPGYNSRTLNDRELEIDGESEIDFSLTHPEFSPSIELVSEEMNISDTTEINFDIENTGNGPLNWSAKLEFRGDNEFEPWELRFTGDNVEGLRATIIVNEMYIMAISTRDGQKISVRNRFGDILYDFEQPGRGNPMGDLTWDGELLWGVRGRDVHGFNLEGELITTFRGPRNPNTVIAWDPDLQVLWIAGSDSDIVGYDVEGNQQETLDHPNGISYNSLTYWGGSPDDYNLYILYYIGDNDPNSYVRKMSTEDGESVLIVTIDTEEDEQVRSAFITDQIYAGSTVLLGVTEQGNERRTKIWQIDQIRSWLSLEPMAGDLEPENIDELLITLSTSAFIEGMYEAEIVFSHNADGGETIIQVSVEVTSEPFNTTRFIPLDVGWNLISTNLQPEEPDFRVIARILVAARRLEMIKDQHGHFYRPDDEFYNMEGWSVEQGYWVLVNRNSILEVTGMTVRSNTPIELQEGWQIVGYYPSHGSNPVLAFSGITENLTLAKDGEGAFYVPEFNFNNIDICKFGKGYMLNMDSADELIWNFRDDEELAMSTSQTPPTSNIHFPSVGVTGSDMSILLLIEDEKISGEIGIFSGDDLIGSATISGSRCGITVRGSNFDSGMTHGAENGDKLKIIWWNGEREHDNLIPELVHGELIYQTDELSVANVTIDNLPVDFALNAVYPNPFNSTIRINYSTPKGGHVKLSVFNLLGREVAKIVDNHVEAGHQDITFNAYKLSTGVYFLRLTSGAEVNIQKITCLK